MMFVAPVGRGGGGEESQRIGVVRLQEWVQRSVRGKMNRRRLWPTVAFAGSLSLSE